MLQRRIRLLDETTINQIAAGEVIENAVSVVKELIENSLDAGATQIHIVTKGGGRGAIRISDNGCGMTKDDLLLALERHATSKLEKVEGLNTLSTLGFRGEALPSIASISKMSLHSSSKEGEGAKVVVEGGRVGAVHPLPRSRGTTLEVSSLFYNVPVRKNFQTTPAAEVGELHRLLLKFACCFPHLSFSWVNDGKTIFSFHEGEGIEMRIEHLLGQEFLNSSLLIDSHSEKVSIKGRIAAPSLHRPNKTGQFVFINGRGVYSPAIGNAVLESYATRLPPRRYPLFLLHLTLPAHWIDVNVHPQKKEIRLREEQSVHSALYAAIEKAFLPQSTPLYFPIAPPVFEETFHEQIAPYTTEIKQPVFDSLPLFVRKISVLGRVKEYFFVEDKGSIYLVHIYRALERVAFEECSKGGQALEIQTLLLPIQLTLGKEERETLLQNLEAFNQIGVAIRPFGGDTFLIDAIPGILERDEIAALIDSSLETGKFSLCFEKCLQKRKISVEMGGVVIEKLFAYENPQFTPRGKQIYQLLDEKKLGKILT